MGALLASGVQDRKRTLISIVRKNEDHHTSLWDFRGIQEVGHFWTN